jgi:hypothetical protein
MKKCQAITKSGMECAANGAHIMMVWVLNAVAYPQDKLPALYANHDWIEQAINVCGAHRNVLVGGKPINIMTSSNVEVTNQAPIMEEDNMTKAKADCPFCDGTGIDKGFWDECKCVSETSPDAATYPQRKYIDDLLKKIGNDWGTPQAGCRTKKQASEVIDLLKQILSLVNILHNRSVTNEQKANIKAKLEAGPTTEWVKAATAKALTLPRKS